MERKIITTSDGSTSIELVDWGECYHSKHGAIQEAYHVFIQNGLLLKPEESIAILEIGFGTGLNAFITLLESQKTNQNVDYVGVEAYPISVAEVLDMNYWAQLNAPKQDFLELHELPWNQCHTVKEHFQLTKRQQFFHEIEDQDCYDLIYFDAFGFPFQPELWSVAIFKKMFQALKNNGILVTYAARGVVKRAMQEVGFQVSKLPGPPGKREMMVAYKILT